MKYYLAFCAFLSGFGRYCYCDDYDDSERENEKFCRERMRPIASIKDDLYYLVDATPGQNVLLQCHHCNEDDDEQPKTWYMSNGLGNITEVPLNMDSNVNNSKFHVNHEHSLIIRDVRFEDSFYYTCKSLQENPGENVFQFYIDVIDAKVSSIETGDIDKWIEYHDEHYLPLNQLFLHGKGREYVYLREKLQLEIEVVTGWESWTECEVCGRPAGEGIKKLKGHCRLKITAKNDTHYDVLNENEIRLVNSTEIACKSRLVNILVPGVFNTTKMVPDFTQTFPCAGTCNPDAEGKTKGWKSTKKKGYKYRKTFVLTENAHLTIVCPESTLDNVVIWRRNGRVLPPGESVEPPKPDMEPKITVDTFNTLYLHEVTKNEEGNYSCQVDKVKMQQVIIFVASKPRLLTQALLRHMMYLGFILSLTLTCYFAGLFITCTRRRKFKTYEEMRLLRKGKHDSSDDEDKAAEYDKQLEKQKGDISDVRDSAASDDKQLRKHKDGFNDESDATEAKKHGDSGDV